MRKVRYWGAERREEILSGYAESGLTVSQYCQNRGVSPSTFHTWRRASKKREKGYQNGFVRIQPSESLRSESAVMRIETPKGYCLEIPAGADGVWIQGIIKALRVK